MIGNFQDNDEKKVWSTEDIRSHCNDWSLAADAALFEHIQSLSKVYYNNVFFNEKVSWMRQYFKKFI